MIKYIYYFDVCCDFMQLYCSVLFDMDVLYVCFMLNNGRTKANSSSYVRYN